MPHSLSRRDGRDFVTRATKKAQIRFNPDRRQVRIRRRSVAAQRYRLRIPYETCDRIFFVPSAMQKYFCD